MRCKKHLTDVSSTVGVCASCLRLRLDALIDQQSDPPIRFQLNSSNPNPNYRQQKQPIQNYHQQQQPPPPLVFPRSVSPYISRRKSEPVQRFYSTPQVNVNKIPPKKQGNKLGLGLGLISRLFRSKSIIPSSSTNSTVNSHNSTVITCRNKGMSPENDWECGEYEERETSESSPARWVNRPSPGRVRPSPARATRAASMAFCLSPLVRASPSRQWRGGTGGEKSGFSGEINATGYCKRSSSTTNGNIESSSNKPHLSVAASFCGNRSRKLADFGRLNPNR